MRLIQSNIIAPAVIVITLALFFCAALWSVRVQAQKVTQLPPPPPVPRYKPKPTPTPEPPQYEVLKVNSNLVMVPVSVTDANGQPVLGLRVEDFRIEENGHPQQIAQIGDPEQVPLDIALLIDVSGSVSTRFGFEQQAAARFLRQVLKPEDRATVFAIDEQPRFIQPLTSASIASEKLMTINTANGYTAFFDSVLAAANYLERSSATGRRRIIVVISDGDDTARILDVSVARSRAGNLQVINMDAQLQLIQQATENTLRDVQRAEATFYSINPSGQTMHLNVRSARSEKGLERISSGTGGASFLPRDESDLAAIFQRIAAEIRSQYLLQYYSNNEAAGREFRKIVVKTPAQSQFKVRTREGYFPKAN